MKRILSYLTVILSLVFLSNAATAGERDQNASYDIKFINSMIEHHNQGIEMFKLASQNTDSKKIKSQVQNLINKDQKDIEKLKSLRSRVADNASESARLSHTDNIDMDELRSKTGKDFDEEFLEAAINHSEDAIEISEDALDKAKNQEVKSKARAIIEEEKQRIDTFKKISE